MSFKWQYYRQFLRIFNQSYYTIIEIVNSYSLKLSKVHILNPSCWKIVNDWTLYNNRLNYIKIA